MSISRYVVVGLFDVIDVGATFSRRHWPAHVTLVSNFVTAASVDDIAGAVRRAGALDAPLRIEFEGVDLFGPNRDIPVRLVVPGRVAEVHRRLVDRLESLGNVVADEPAYWRAGYRPHLTLSGGIEADHGERRVVTDIAIARLEADAATVVAAIGTQERGAPAGVAVRRGTAGDAPGLAVLKTEWARLDRTPSVAEMEEFAVALGDWILNAADSLVIAVAIADGAMVGMAWMVLFERAPDFADRHRLTADIQSVYVTPDWRGQGIGTRLVDELCREADRRGVPRVLVTANARAVELYRRVGFDESPMLLERRLDGARSPG